MRKLRNIVVLALCWFLVAQSDGKNKNKKVYRTQWGTFITAPETPEENQVKKSKKEMTKIQKQIQAKLNKSSKKNNQRVNQLKTDYDSQIAKMQADYDYQISTIQLDYNSQISRMQEQINLLYKIAENSVDTVFSISNDTITVYDSTVVYDTTFIYTNATTTVYDTAVFYDSLYVYNYDTTTIVNTNIDTLVVYDTTFVNTYDTTLVKDTLWVFAYDTTFVYDTSWVFAYDTTFVRDSIWVFAHDTMVVYDTTTVVNNDTVTIHTYATNFKPEMIDGQQAQFPIWQSLDDAIQARNAGDERAQEWINEALYAADGDWNRAKDEYKRFQNIYSSATVKSILGNSFKPDFIGPRNPRDEMKYRSVTYDTLRIMTFDTLVMQDTIRDLVRQSIMSYDTSVVIELSEVIQNTTPQGHEMAIRYHDNGRVKERGPMKGLKRNGTWIFYSLSGNEIRKTTYDMGRIIKDEDLVNNRKNVHFKKQQTKRPKSLAKVVHTKYDTPPKPKSRIMPVVDVAHGGATVIVQFLVNREGVVEGINIIKSSAIADIDQAAISSIENTDFKPATINDVPTASWEELEILFPSNPLESVLSPGMTKEDFYSLYLGQVLKGLENEGIELSKKQQDKFLVDLKTESHKTYSEIEALYLEEEVGFLKNEIQNFIFHMDNEEGTLQSGVQLYRATSESRITLIDQDGTVLADSHMDEDNIEGMDNHGNRPEILSSTISEYGVAVRHSKTINKKLIYVSYAVDEQGDDRRVFVRFSKPLGVIQEQRALRIYEMEILNALKSGNIDLPENSIPKFLANYTQRLKDKLAESGYGVDIEANEKIIQSYTDKLESKSQEIADDLKREIDTFINYLNTVSMDGIHSSVASYAQSADVRITLIDSKGEVLADSDLDLIQLSRVDNHINRSEVVQANTLPYGTVSRFSNTLQRQFVYVARRIQSVNEKEVQYVRLAKSLRSDYSKVDLEEDTLLDLYLSLIYKSFGRASVNLPEKKKDDFGNYFKIAVKNRNGKVKINHDIKYYRIYIEEINQALDKTQLMISLEQEESFLKIYRENAMREFSLSNNVDLEVNEESVRTYLKNLASKEERQKKLVLKEGIFITYHDNGRIKEKGEYISGRKEGNWKVYNQRGSLINTLNYKKGKLVKTDSPDRIKNFANYHENGRIKEQGITINGNRDGEWKFYNSRGKLEKITIYAKGKIIQQDNPEKMERSTEYHENGRIRAQGLVKNGKKDGVWKLYSSRGKMVKSVTYASGKIIRDDGSSKKDAPKSSSRKDSYLTYHDNGRIKVSGSFKDNKKSGEWREYDERGKIITITIYSNGGILFQQNPNKVKEYTSYHSNGRIKEQGMFNGKKRDGEWHLYSKRGKLLRKTNYFQGDIIKQNSTRIIDSFVTYHKNGFVKEEGILKMGQRDGIWKRYDDDGEHIETVTYINGKVLSREKA